MRHFVGSLRASLALLGLLTLLLGGIYPMFITVIAQGLFPAKANGSVIERGGKVMGSALIGQQFDSPKYFWGRLSATEPPYNAAASAGSNLGPTNPRLLQLANERMQALQKADPQNKSLVPIDLITASASGLDPHISVIAAEYQIRRVAKTRGIKEEAVRSLIKKYTEVTVGDLAAHEYVNVLKLNMALDEKEVAGFR